MFIFLPPAVTYTVQERFQLANLTGCEDIRYIGVEILKGDNDEMSSDWLNKTTIAPVKVLCSTGKFLMLFLF